MATRYLSWLQRGHDEARVGLALCPFRLGDHAPPSAPALPGRPAQVLEAPRRLARPSGLLLGLDQLDRDLLDEAIVAGKSEYVVDPVLLAPGHQDLAGEARVGPKQDAHPRPAGPDPGNDPLDLRDRPRRGIVGPRIRARCRTRAGR